MPGRARWQQNFEEEALQQMEKEALLNDREIIVKIYYR
jgi:hypothetical protein